MKKPIYSLVRSEMLETVNGTEKMYSLIFVGVKVQIILLSSLAYKIALVFLKVKFSLYFSGTFKSNSKGIQELFLIESFYLLLTP